MKKHFTIGMLVVALFIHYAFIVQSCDDKKDHVKTDLTTVYQSMDGWECIGVFTDEHNPDKKCYLFYKDQVYWSVCTTNGQSNINSSLTR